MAPTTSALHAPLVTFLFGSRGLGGAERSMLRLITAAHPAMFRAQVVVVGQNDQLLAEASKTGWAEPVRVVQRLAELFRYFRKERPDVAYVFGRGKALAWMAVARAAGVPHVISAERSSAAGPIDKVQRLADRWLVHDYVANSVCAARNLTSIHKIPSSRIHVAPNGIPDDWWPIPNDPSSNPSRLISIANLLPTKGHIFLLRAFRNLRRARPELTLTLVGRDYMSGELQRIAQAESLTEGVVWAGFHADVRPFLANADVFVLPSVALEGQPTSILEAMWAGLPVVATRVGGVQELVRDGETGILVAPGSETALTDALDIVLSDAVLRNRIIRQACAAARSDNSMAAMAQSHQRVFNRKRETFQ